MKLKYFILFLLVAVGASNIHAQKFRFSDYAQPNEDDQTAALQTMFNDALKGGGTVYLDFSTNGNKKISVCGTLYLWAPVDPYSPVGITIEGDDSVLVPCENKDQVLFNAGNLTKLIIKNLTVASAKEANSAVPDLKTVVRTGYVAQFVMEKVTLAGIKARTNAIESYYSDILSINNCIFGGNASGFSLIYIYGARLATVEGSFFHDYLGLKVTGNEWSYYSDTALNLGYWIYASGVHMLRTESVHFDEGAPIAVRVEDSLYANFNFTSFDISGIAGGAGVFAHNTRQTVLNQSSPGLTNAPHDLLVLKENSKASVNHGYLRGSWIAGVPTGAKFCTYDSTSEISLADSMELQTRTVMPAHNGWMYTLSPYSVMKVTADGKTTAAKPNNSQQTASTTEDMFLAESSKWANSKPGLKWREKRISEIESKFRNKRLKEL